MGITVEQILEEMAKLLESVRYWKQCQPHRVPPELEQQIQVLIEQVDNYKT